MSNAVFEISGEKVVAGELARGPWDPRAQHGGAPAALIMRAFETLEPDPALTIARVTYELLRPVPLGELALVTEVLRSGRRAKLLEARLLSPDGTELVRARGLKLARAGVERLPAPDATLPAPDGAPVADLGTGGELRFGGDALQLRFVSGAFDTPGPAQTWFRLKVPLVAGEAASPLQRLACAADFPNGVGSLLAWRDYTFLNPDLTIYVEREPVGEWIGLDAAMRVREGGIAFAEAVLFDTRGRVGRSLQSVLIAERPA